MGIPNYAMNKKLLVLMVLLGFIAVAVYNFIGASTTIEGYKDKITTERKEKDVMFKQAEDSPLTEAQKEIFNTLNYFPVSEKYRINAEFSKNPREQIVKMAITGGSQREYYIYGNAHFHFNGKELNLTVYKSVNSEVEYLFIPFYDATSAELTYGGGRYVEPKLVDGGTLEIDFNLAYNPYCAYNHTYRCPIPPQDNNLTVSIMAGEKIPEFVNFENL